MAKLNSAIKNPSILYLYMSMQISQHYNLKVFHFVYKKKNTYHEVFRFSQMKISVQKMRDKVFVFLIYFCFFFNNSWNSECFSKIFHILSGRLTEKQKKTFKEERKKHQFNGCCIFFENAIFFIVDKLLFLVPPLP